MIDYDISAQLQVFVIRILGQQYPFSASLGIEGFSWPIENYLLFKGTVGTVCQVILILSRYEYEVYVNCWIQGNENK